MDLFVTGTIAFLLAGLIKGVLGFGFPIIALIVLTLSIGLLDALAIIVVPTLVTNIWQAMSGPHLRAIFRRMGLLLRYGNGRHPRSIAISDSGQRRLVDGSAGCCAVLFRRVTIARLSYHGITGARAPPFRGARICERRADGFYRVIHGAVGSIYAGAGIRQGYAGAGDGRVFSRCPR